MSDIKFWKWCREFSDGSTNIRNEDRSGGPSLVTEELAQYVEDPIRIGRRFTLSELNVNFPEILQPVPYEAVTETLH